MGNINFKISYDDSLISKINDIHNYIINKTNNNKNTDESKVFEKNKNEYLEENKSNISKKILKNKKRKNKIKEKYISDDELNDISFTQGLSEIKKFDKNDIEMINVYGVNTSYYRNGKGKLMVRKKKSKWEKVAVDEGYNFIENSEYTMKMPPSTNDSSSIASFKSRFTQVN